MATKIIMPKLGESVVEGTVVNWLKQEGDTVEEFESLLEVESAKVSTEIPSPAGGTLLKILVEAGATVDADTIIGWIGEPGEEIPQDEGASPQASAHAAPQAEAAPEPAAAATPPGEESAPAAEVESPQPAAPPAAPGRDRDLGFISPVVAKIAAEHNLDLSQIPGTGQGGRITKKDVLAFAQNRPASTPQVEAPAWETPGEGDLFRPTELQFPDRFSQRQTAPAGAPSAAQTAPQAAPKIAAVPQNGQLIPHTKMRKAIADHMLHSKHTAPHVTTVMEADLFRVSAHRDKSKPDYEKQGTRLTFTAYFIAAAAQALREHPMVNSTWTDEGVLHKANVNVGMAASLGEAGLIVPVIKNADSYSLLGLARMINDLTERARAQKLVPDEVTGGTFTITNHGTAGSLFATPIINQPQCAILGVGIIQKRVKVVEDAIAIRPMVYLSLTFDHRILDGAAADNFLARIVEILENWQ